MAAPEPVAKPKPIETKHLMRSLFSPPLDDYPENMQAHVAAMRKKLGRRHALSNVLSVLSYAAMICILIVSALLIALATDRTPPTSVLVKITTPNVKPGGKLSMTVLVDRKRICASRVRFLIFDGDGRVTTVEMPWHDAAGPLGVDAPFTRTLTLPPDAVPGAGRLRIERSYMCPLNPFHRTWPVTATDVDQIFDIVKP